jgi:hypothetical protein
VIFTMSRSYYVLQEWMGMNIRTIDLDHDNPHSDAVAVNGVTQRKYFPACQGCAVALKTENPIKCRTKDVMKLEDV